MQEHELTRKDPAKLQQGAAKALYMDLSMVDLPQVSCILRNYMPQIAFAAGIRVKGYIHNTNNQWIL